jgi:hypothetical protein
MDRILPFFAPPLPCVDSFYTLSVDKNRHKYETIKTHPCAFLTLDILKVSKSQKQIMVSSILPKNEQNSLS